MPHTGSVIPCSISMAAFLLPLTSDTKLISQLSLSLTHLVLAVVLRLWLGIPLFLLSPLCVCLAPIDQFGDHHLECSHGPMRIRRHDALVDIVCHALSQSHPGVLKEQRGSFPPR